MTTEQGQGEKYSVAEMLEPTSGWSAARQDLYWRAIAAFDDGDLQPLGAYLREGYRIDAGIAGRLASAIAGGHPIKIRAQRVGPLGSERDRTAYSTKAEKYAADLKIGVEAYRRTKLLPRGQWDAAIIAIASDFNVGTTRVKSALALVKQQLKFKQGSALWIDLVTLTHELRDELDGG